MDFHQKRQQFERDFPELLQYVWVYVTPRVFAIHDRPDVVSDIMVHAYEILKAYDPEQGNMRQWITGIAHYRILHYIRDRKSTFSLDEAQELSTHTKKELEEVVHAKLSTDVIFDQLSHEQRALITLHLVDGISLEEIARREGLPATTIRKRFSRLRSYLRTHFSRYY